jgi:hypothetical protein
MTKRALGLLAVLLLALLGACGGGGEDAAGETTTTEAAAAADDPADDATDDGGSTDGDDVCAELLSLEDPEAMGDAIVLAADFYKAQEGITAEEDDGGSFSGAGCTDGVLHVLYAAPDGTESLLSFEWDGETPTFIEAAEPVAVCEDPDVDEDLAFSLGCS